MAKAGTELGLTHGAVSRRVAALKGWLGQCWLIPGPDRFHAARPNVISPALY